MAERPDGSFPLRSTVLRGDDKDNDYYLAPWRRGENSKRTNSHLIETIHYHYGYELYSVFERAEEDWWTHMPNSAKRLRHLIIIDSSIITVKSAKKAGIVAYANEVIKRTKKVSKELRERHDRKAHLLSSALRKSAASGP